MTEDDDRVAYLAGEGRSDIEAMTRADLDDLRGLLADEALWAEPPAGLEGDVLAAIAAEVAATPPRAEPADQRPEAAPPPPDRIPAPATVTSLAARRARRLRAGLGAAAAVVALAVAGVVITRSGKGDSGTDVALEADTGPGAAGTANLRQTDSGWRIELDATGLPRRDNGQFYEAWLRNADGVLVSIGTFNEGTDVTLWAGVPPSEFSTLTVTAEEADGDPASSGVRVLVGTIVLD